jgi:hypothetical protein
MPPREHQTLANAAAGRDGVNSSARLLRLSNDPRFVQNAPSPPPLTPGEEFHHAIHQHTFTTALTIYLR